MVEQIYILGQNQPSPQGGSTLLIGMILFVGVFFFMTSRSQKRDKKKKADLLDNLSKNDKVVTIGGVVGTVVGVKENEITLKVDESTNTRMTFIKSAIQRVVKGDADLQSNT